MATGRRPVISVKRGGVTTSRQSTVRQKECGRVTCKRLESSPVPLKSQPLIKPILSLDSGASPIAMDAASFGLWFIVHYNSRPETLAG
jgi:hypothetical protein